MAGGRVELVDELEVVPSGGQRDEGTHSAHRAEPVVAHHSGFEELLSARELRANQDVVRTTVISGFTTSTPGD